MHRDQRKQLAIRLFGEGRDRPGPLRPEWVRERLGISSQTLMKWRQGGIPAGRVDDVLAALEELTGTTKEPPEPAWLEGLVREVRMNRAVIQAAMSGADPAFVSRVLNRLAALESPPTLSDDEARDPIDAAT